MKKIITILIILVSISCSTNETISLEPLPIGGGEIIPKDIKIIITTSELINDEIQVAYKKNPDEDEYEFGPRQFEYEANGTPIPIIITLEGYNYLSIIGNAYRNNDLPSSLKVELYINNELVLEDESTGTTGVYATINFDYEITN